jgi:hypothetical protein
MSILESFFCEYSNVIELDEQCPICFDPLYNIDILETCKHRVHLSCIEKFATCNSLSHAECPLCRCPTPEASYTPEFDTSNIIKYEVISNTQVRAQDANGVVALLQYIDDDQESLSDNSLYFSDSEIQESDAESHNENLSVFNTTEDILKFIENEDDLDLI